MKDLIKNLHSSPQIKDKTAIANIWNYLPDCAVIDGKNVYLGDDAAAIENKGEYLLFAAEGVFQPLLKSDPYLAGRTSVLTNISDIYAMGGRPVAILDVLFSSSDKQIKEVLSGIYDNSTRYGVPVVGGHINSDSKESALSVSILGKAKKLLTSFNAKDGDALLIVTSAKGKFVADNNFWDSSSELNSDELLRQLEILPNIAEQGLADAAKDISMAGSIGSILMLLECSKKGAEIFTDEITIPPGVSLEKWLLTFPSYGFVLSVRPENSSKVQEKFEKHGLLCEKIGNVTADKKIFFILNGNKELFWDLNTHSYIGINNSKAEKVING